MLSGKLRMHSEQAADLESGREPPAPSMSGFLPSFLRRTRLLRSARRALLEGECERALELLGDPCLALSPTAERLRRRVLENLWRKASRKKRSGRTGSVARLIDLVAREDPGSADDWSRRLLPAVPGGVSPEPGDPPSAASRIAERLLEEVRGFVRSVDPGREGEPAAAPPPRLATGSASSARGDTPHFHMAVDDVGEFLVACRPSLVLGHSRGGRADLPFFSDLEAEHARLVLEESFHVGPRWSLEGLVESAFEIAGATVEGGRRTLEHGDEVRLGAGLAFRFLAPDPSSASAILHVLHGVECEGASRILLLAEGEAGRVRMGALTRCHFAVPGLEEEVTLHLEGGRLHVRSESAYRTLPEGAGSGVAPARLSVPCPPPERHVFVGAPRGENRPPFSFTVLPGGAP